MPDTTKEIPDVYSDLFNIHENPLSVVLVLSQADLIPPINSNAPQQVKTVAVLRFSPANWKTILMTGRKQMKAREQSQGAPYKVPDEILKPLGLTEADW